MELIERFDEQRNVSDAFLAMATGLDIVQGRTKDIANQLKAVRAAASLGKIGFITPAGEQITLPIVHPPIHPDAKSVFKFGDKSESELVGVLPIMIKVARRGLELTTQDYGIYDGLRTPTEQARYVAAGKSQTMNSKHLMQRDGFSHAFDAVPYINGAFKWDWEGCYRVALGIDQAATELEVADKIVWGGAWDRRLSDFGGSVDLYRREVQLYAARHPGPDFVDGPHYEWRG